MTGAELAAVDAGFADVDVLGGTVAQSALELASSSAATATILRAAELVRGCGAPVLGINMGACRFLARSNATTWTTPWRRVIARDYDVEERMGLSGG